MKVRVAFDNLSAFFNDDDDELKAEIPAEVFRNERGKIIEIRIYNPEYEEMITVGRDTNVEALSVDEFYK